MSDYVTEKLQTDLHRYIDLYEDAVRELGEWKDIVEDLRLEVQALEEELELGHHHRDELKEIVDLIWEVDRGLRPKEDLIKKARLEKYYAY